MACNAIPVRTINAPCGIRERETISYTLIPFDQVDEYHRNTIATRLNQDGYVFTDKTPMNKRVIIVKPKDNPKSRMVYLMISPDEYKFIFEWENNNG